jgi:geranylgeranyl diphosphate synthase type II
MMSNILQNYKEFIDKKLANYIEERLNGSLYSALKYAVIVGGKRLRPIIMLGLSNEFGLNEQMIISGLIGIEFIHNYSLIQDDLPSFDDDDHRRGKKTVHKKFKEDTAILASDVLLTEGMYLFSRLPENEKIMNLVNNSIGIKGLLSGQYLDMEEDIKDFEQLINIYKLKTSSLFKVSFLLPVILAKKVEYEEKIQDIAQDFGIAFQIYNDLRSTKKENKGILKLHTHKKANEIFGEYLDKARNIFGIIKKNDTRKLFDGIFSLLEEK